jgi:Sperm-tail PG-rich repeat
MIWTGRNQQCWKANTPEQVGPGAYYLNSNRPQRTSTAPFDSGEVRITTSTSQNSPGFYIGHKSWGSKSRCSSSLSSRVPRLAEIKDINPGPGTYNIASVNQSKITYAKHVPVNSGVDRTPPSIPSKEIKPYNLGPGSYDPNFHDNKLVSKGTSFGAYLSKREVFENVNINDVGPGQYSTVDDKKNKSSWMFNSSTKKPSNNAVVKNNNPGPGSYELSVNNSINENNVGFGSNTKKDIPLSKDPHRPFIVGDKKSPPVGCYLSKEDYQTYEKLKKKLISADYPIEKPPFNTGEKRIRDPSSNTPGPGYYQLMIEKSNKGLLTNKSPRFDSKDSKTPGPGSYKPVIPESQKPSTFTSKTPRFEKNIKVMSNDTYQKHQPWSLKQTRALDYAFIEKKLSFDSTGHRFNKSKVSGPGPGQYEVMSVSYTQKSNRSTLFKNPGHPSSQSRTGTPLNVGPGSYELDENYRKTFNMAKELGKANVWL